MRSWKTIVLIILSISIAGCAINNRTFGTRNTAFDDGQKLIAQGQFENGLAKLEQAQREEPDNKEIRTMLIRLREDVISKILLEADGFRFSGDLDQAEQQYQRVLNLYPFHERAKEGIDAVKLERRHIAAVDAARALLVRNDFKGAETMVRAILQENPQQSHARQLIAQINANLSRPEVTDLALESAFKKSVSMEFKDADLKSVFEIMSRTAGINFVFDKDIRQDGKISIFVRDNTIEDILKLILTTNQLAYKVLNSNSLLIYPNTPAKLKDYQELVVRSFQVAYTDVKQMVAMVRGIVKAKDIYVNEQLNLFIMRDTLEAIRLTERLVSLNDLAEPEVMLDVAVLEITRNNLFTLGPKLPQSVTFSGLTAAGAGAIPGTANLNQIGSGALGLKSFTISNQAVIDFAQSLTNADILANPRIRVSNREKAKIHIGTKQPVFTANVQPGINSIVTSTPTFIDIGIKLDVEPRIGLNDDVTMKVTLEVSNITGFETGPSAAGASSAPRAPVVGNRSAETLLTLKDGETQVIAGLIQNDERRDVSGLAGLLNIPILDRLTSGQRVDRKKTEVVLLITPRIIRNIPKPANMESEYHFGTASEAGKLPVVIQKTAAQSLAIAPTGTGSGAAAGRGLNAFAAAREESDIPNPFANVAATTPTLTMQAPTTVGLDKEFSVNVRLVGAKPMVNSELQLNYEASVLEALDGGDKSGTRTIKLGRDQTTGLATQVRFKVIAANPGITEISIQNVTAEDLETGESVDVALPATATVNIK
ncbi:secretin and TonB N-terminal domain-containing protein [Nitrosomonas ureae]|uniref:General secretion pathway protein D n=1 Tax=Nitrosomonas ureae TaxID=44577 RepID=A0A1H2DSX9_9PROT|nr:secretin and TonB N-terminal domain-containing protein [Nitrosomonas ureae]ALQ50797.1 general secretion pathway protein GspD [Nitrosomonas ureae]SDT85926.1 general secretion pathway protein D [Nitrosomonas ureae]